jgi:dihydrofolate reductase
MRNLKIIIIAAVSVDGVIGIGDEIPWRIPEDFKHFREITMGNILIVGRTTYLTLPPKALEGREYIILNGGNRINDLDPNNFQFSTLDTILYLLNDKKIGLEKVFIAGGASIYDQFIDQCDEAIITWVDETYPNGDKKFPIYKLFTNFTAEESEWMKSKNNYDYKIMRYVRNGSKEETQIKTNNND